MNTLLTETLKMWYKKSGTETHVLLFKKGASRSIIKSNALVAQQDRAAVS